MVDRNHQVYTASEIVNHYRQLCQLQPAEQTILNLFRNEWSRIKMLDIGVGGGRTTQHFSEIVQEYMGIDYAQEMITACQKRFPASTQLSSRSRKFELGDARNMSQFANNSFDFILFSFNGLDTLSHLERLQVFQEISRIGKSGGYFFFSSHSLQGLEREFNWLNQISFNPLTTYVNLVMLGLLRFFNRSISLKRIKSTNYEIIQDESHNFRLKQYYIRPQEQLNQLEAAFDNIKIYSWKSGLEITTPEDLNANADMWLYYLCQIK
ncbi:class I SAM-dependent methyltransferase [Pseudanabaena sp. FACHB-1998]|uniref:class I SAM-dependent methyltransferase n=1 Tax=Pseudanabaena sp. FACHB-1998 TaxID=2692858 RepID=UPI0016816114|nr:class I SAM-dependent methyltransferase [Pseudanabaena sp. FACHB-1998]MBD2177424.1 class I SAM-dependent methyltransferase [Pseudanabaena sp. FACHB-1998]